MRVAKTQPTKSRKEGRKVSKQNYAKLRGAIRAKFSTQAAFAAAIEMRVSTLSAKLNGRSEWTKSQIVRTCEVLGIPVAEAPAYFFTE